MFFCCKSKPQRHKHKEICEMGISRLQTQWISKLCHIPICSIKLKVFAHFQIRTISRHGRSPWQIFQLARRRQWDSSCRWVPSERYDSFSPSLVPCFPPPWTRPWGEDTRSRVMCVHDGAMGNVQQSIFARLSLNGNFHNIFSFSSSSRVLHPAFRQKATALEKAHKPTFSSFVCPPEVDIIGEWSLRVSPLLRNTSPSYRGAYRDPNCCFDNFAADFGTRRGTQISRKEKLIFF